MSEWSHSVGVFFSHVNLFLHKFSSFSTSTCAWSCLFGNQSFIFLRSSLVFFDVQCVKCVHYFSVEWRGFFSQLAGSVQVFKTTNLLLQVKRFNTLDNEKLYGKHFCVRAATQFIHNMRRNFNELNRWSRHKMDRFTTKYSINMMVRWNNDNNIERQEKEEKDGEERRKKINRSLFDLPYATQSKIYFWLDHNDVKLPKFDFLFAFFFLGWFDTSSVVKFYAYDRHWCCWCWLQ